MKSINEFKHLMSIISELALKVEYDYPSDNPMLTKKKAQVLKESKEWINWWITNKQQMKALTDKLKDCKTKEEQSMLLAQMLDLVKAKIKSL